MKSRLNKLDGLTHKELKTNIDKVIEDKYENIIKETYNRTNKYGKKPSNGIKTLKNYKCIKFKYEIIQNIIVY
jgi:hypothetical protein